jgi:hypothetical protein
LKNIIKKLILGCLVLYAVSFTSGYYKPDGIYTGYSIITELKTKEEIVEEFKKLEKQFFPINETLQEIPEDYFTTPDDWVEIEFNNGVSMKVPPGLDYHKESDENNGQLLTYEIYSNKNEEEKKKATTSVGFLSMTDWAEDEKYVYTYEEAMAERAIFEHYNIIPFDRKMKKLNKNLYDAPLAKLGIETKGTRYGRIKGLLSITEADIAGLNEVTANTIRFAKGVSLMDFTNAYIIEKENAHIFIHKYGEKVGKYWISVMPTDSLEYGGMIKAEDKDTALRIAASAELKSK